MQVEPRKENTRTFRIYIYSCARSWKFLICLGGLVTLIVLVCIVKNHVQDHANKFDERLEDIQERMNVSEKLANHLKEHTQGLSKRLDGMTIREFAFNFLDTETTQKYYLRLACGCQLRRSV